MRMHTTRGGTQAAPNGSPSPSPSVSPIPHALGSRVVVPSNWSIVPSPNVSTTNNEELDGVSCVTASFCMAVGDVETGTAYQTLTQRWNGSSWSIVASPDPSSTLDAQLSAVSCLTTSFCMAVGTATNGTVNQTLAEQWNGANWSIVASPNPSATVDNDLSDISCTSKSFCVAVGQLSSNSVEQSLIEQWNGSSWSVVASPGLAAGVAGNELDGVSCVSSTFCQAVGANFFTSADSSTLVDQWNGTFWSTVSSPNVAGSDNYLSAVSCSGVSFCMAVGESDVENVSQLNLAEQWNGTMWSVVPTPNANAAFGNTIFNVDCFGPTSCVAGGYVNTIDNSDNTYATQMLNWNGSAWALVNVPQPEATAQDDQVNGVSCVAGAMCVGVGYATYGSNAKSPDVGGVFSDPRPGYDEVAADGGIFNFGGAGFYGSLGSLILNKPIVGMAVTPDGGGYWLVAADGGVFAEGDAGFFGSLGGTVLNKPIVGIAATPNGGGYWLVAADGGIFNYGDAGFFGSLGGTVLNKPVVGMTAAPDGQGYWLVASDGGIFNYGTAGFLGSLGGTVLNKPVVGMAATPDGGGYWLVASDGGIFAKGDAGFFGSEGGTVLNKPVVGMAATPDGRGYWMVASDGGIFAKGDAVFSGSMGGKPLNQPIVGMGA